MAMDNTVGLQFGTGGVVGVIRGLLGLLITAALVATYSDNFFFIRWWADRRSNVPGSIG